MDILKEPLEFSHKTFLQFVSNQLECKGKKKGIYGHRPKMYRIITPGALLPSSTFIFFLLREFPQKYSKNSEK